VVDNIIIIGGGIVGASFAYHAKINQINKIFLFSDALPGDSQQATTNTWGWVNGYAHNDKEYAALRLASLNYWAELFNNIQTPSFTSKGAFFWDLDDPEIHQTIKQHQSWGHSVEIKNKVNLEHALPNLLNVPDNAGYGKNDLAVEATQITKKLLKLSQAQIIQKKVDKLLMEENEVKGVLVEDQIHYADEVILASGLGTSDLLKTININFSMKSTLGLLAYTNELPPLLRHPITGIDFHARQDNQGRLIIGGRFDDDASKDSKIEEAAKKLVSDMASRLNYKGVIRLDHFTLGNRPLPNDGRPKIGRVKNSTGDIIKGAYIAVMHSGITNAPIVGKFGIEEILTGESNSFLHSFTPQLTNE